MNSNSPIRNRFEEFLQRGDLDGLEEAWLDEIARAGDRGPTDPQAFLWAADALMDRGDLERAMVLLELLLPADPQGKLDVLRRMMVASPDRRDLRSEFLRCFREVDPGDRFGEICLEVAQVETAADIRSAIQFLDRLLQFRPGTCVFHREGWGVGVVESADQALRQAVVDLEKKRHHRIDLRVIGEILEPLPPDHFLALGRDGGEPLRNLAGSDPVKLVEIVIRSFGNPQELKALKALLLPSVISSETWNRWWGRTKNLLRESGFFRVTDRAPYLIERLDEAFSFEDELLRQFESGSWQERLLIARKHSRPRAGKFPALMERILAELQTVCSQESGCRALEASLILERMTGESSLAARALQSAPDPAEAILGVENTDDRRRAVESLPGALAMSWPAIALELLSRGDDGLRDQVVRLLEESDARDRAVQLIKEALRVPRNSPQIFAWASRRYISGEGSPLLELVHAQPPQDILRRILDLLDHLGMAVKEKPQEVRELLGKARGLLSTGECRFFRETIPNISRDEAREIYQRVLSSGGLSQPLRVRLLEILMSKFSDISRPQERQIWEEDFLYVTQEGLQRKQEEFRELTQEKLPKNFEDIGRAAAFGDLSENAEYTSALEERDRLTKRATELKENLDRVRLITPSMVKEGEISLGSRVRLVSPQTGHQATYRLFGPWDGNPDEGVLSYRSPLAIGLLGKRVGDEVEVQLPGGVELFRVEEIGSAFEPGST